MECINWSEYFENLDNDQTEFSNWLDTNFVVRQLEEYQPRKVGYYQSYYENGHIAHGPYYGISSDKYKFVKINFKNLFPTILAYYVPDNFNYVGLQDFLKVYVNNKAIRIFSNRKLVNSIYARIDNTNLKYKDFEYYFGSTYNHFVDNIKKSFNYDLYFMDIDYIIVRKDLVSDYNFKYLMDNYFEKIQYEMIELKEFCIAGKHKCIALDENGKKV